jgi:beta-glucosidase
MTSYSGLNNLDRIEYLNDHLHAARHTIDKGIPLAGYFFWSLLDNYEWNKGYDPQFGLVQVVL